MGVRFLIACLTITPLRESFGINLLRYRRQIGLLAFCYALLHLTVYTVLDQGLDVSAIVADIVKRPYITIGMAAFALPLEQSPLVLGPIAGFGTFLIILHYG